MSRETKSSSVTVNMPRQRSSFAAFFKIELTSSVVVFLLEMKVMSTIEPTTTGTRIDMPSKRPCSCGNALVTAMEAKRPSAQEKKEEEIVSNIGRDVLDEATSKKPQVAKAGK